MRCSIKNRHKHVYKPVLNALRNCFLNLINRSYICMIWTTNWARCKPDMC